MSPEMIMSALMWAALSMGTLVLSLLTWFALRVVKQLDHVSSLLVDQNTAFSSEIHKHDLRLANLEARAGWHRRDADAKS